MFALFSIMHIYSFVLFLFVKFCFPDYHIMHSFQSIYCCSAVWYSTFENKLCYMVIQIWRLQTLQGWSLCQNVKLVLQKISSILKNLLIYYGVFSTGQKQMNILLNCIFMFTNLGLYYSTAEVLQRNLLYYYYY